MKIPDIEERITYWKYAYSRTALQDAKRWAETLLKDESNMDAGTRAAFVQAIVISYARPFTKSQVTKSRRIIPMDDIQPLSKLESVHRDILDLRDQLFGHKDGTEKDSSGLELNRVILSFDCNGFDLYTRVPHNIEEKQLRSIIELCTHFIEEAQIRLSPLRCLLSSPERPRQGAYSLQILSDELIPMQ